MSILNRSRLKDKNNLLPLLQNLHDFHIQLILLSKRQKEGIYDRNIGWRGS